ncbi:MAG: lipocalin-like domain-containing protein [Acidobacteria bacterium]|nr:lipocalin-like domain-containing protein [Acidobacteriota bacterium]MXZ70410.1 lipocalin-like domain-containing protein [Acidobacteriota bacterium]MYJ06323.1 lipocalin-like domain-containing protein [Acidobacteriota bacterium]
MTMAFACWRGGACTILVVAAFVVAGCGAADSGAVADADAAAEAVDPREQFAGTWRLVRTERYDQRGEPLSDLMHPTIGLADVLGYLMYDGDRFGRIVQRVDRSAEDIQAALEGYEAYFGAYEVREAEGYVRYRIAGSVNPRLTGTELESFYEFSGGQLVLTPGLRCPDSYVARNGCAYGTTGIQLRHFWDRVAPSQESGAAAEPFHGFWAIDRLERQSLDGGDLSANQYADGYLAYMPSGQMAVQLMRPDRRRYEGPRPTAAEAEAAMETYASYFGPFSLEPGEDVVVHHRAGHLDPDQVGTDARRAFAFRDGQLVLQPPVSTDAEGREVQTSVYWNRVSARDSAAVAPTRD